MSSRRSFLAQLTGLGIAAVLPSRGATSILAEIPRRAALYFFEQADPETGLVRDRARVTGVDDRRIASIAATGFGLSALSIAAENGYLPLQEVRTRIARTMQFLAKRATHEQGFYPHFLDMANGQRAWQSEYSSIDTAWLLCGVMHCRQMFPMSTIALHADEILERVNWPWMLNGGETLSHGWTPERGFLPYRWDSYAELMAMYLLALGSPSHPIPESSWNAWRRPERTYEGLTYIEAFAPLFAHQYSHAWIDFRGRRDEHADYFENSRTATEAHKRYCVRLADRFPWYSDEMWGVTASDSRRGYLAWGGPGVSPTPDGTLVPCAAGGSVAFLPGPCQAVLEQMHARYGDRVWGRYGFVDAFHPEAQWFSPDVIGIDLGVTMLMAENAKNGAVWKAMSAAPEIQLGLQKAGFNRATISA